MLRASSRHFDPNLAPIEWALVALGIISGGYCAKVCYTGQL